MRKADFAIITGSGFYDFEDMENVRQENVKTSFGEVQVSCGRLHGREVAFIPRHNKGHTLLPNMIDHRANITACHELGVKVIIGTSIMGVANKDIPLGKLLVFNDLFYPDNRLGDGTICSLYTEEGQDGRGHFMFDSPFYDVKEALKDHKDAVFDLTYAHVNGPRFNSKKEISFFKQFADAVSQTCGPEAVMSGELEMPYILLGFGVDYANGVTEDPTPVSVLQENMAKSKAAFKEAITKILHVRNFQFRGFIYRCG